VENLHNIFDKFYSKTNEAIKSLYASKNRVMAMRDKTSISGNQNLFEQIKIKHDELKN
jgi:hypothetical protein